MAVSEKAISFMQGNMERGKAIPGQSLTNSPEDPYKWEQPAEFTNSKEAMLYVFENLTVPETTSNILLSLSKGIGVIDIASITLYTGFTEGKWNPDLMMLLMEPTMYMIMALAEKAEIDYIMDSEDEIEEEEILGDKAVEQIEKGIGSLDAMRKQAAQRVSPQSVPQEVRKVIEETKIAPSILQKVEQEQNQSLLAKEE
tara:strand:- start:6029 stop:6625 length:597 start_codon:yes stop_codon:yes gene_type:complete